MAENPNYYAIIPANVRYDNSLPANARLLYGEITALCNKEGYCWATNSYFAELYGVSKKTISAWITALSKKGYILSHIRYKEGTPEILDRYLEICGGVYRKIGGTPEILDRYPENCGEGIPKNRDTPIPKKVTDNITRDNITRMNNTYEVDNGAKAPRAARFTPPTLEEVRAYCAERGSNVDPERFIDFYSSKGWMVGKNKMKDWKAAIRGWESRSGQAAQQQKSGGDRLLDMIRSGTFDE